MSGADDAAVPRWHAAGMHQLPDHHDWMAPVELERLDGLRFRKRRDEWRLARWTAKHTLAGALGMEVDDATLRRLVVRNAPDGAPEAFVDDAGAGLAIAMTDRADWAVCTTLVGGAAVGCDLEVVEPRSDAFVEDWFTAAERALVRSPASDHDLLANLVWSAKESALKVLRTGLRRDTRSVEVALADPPARSGTSWEPLRVTTAEGRRFDGWWRRAGEFVLTVVSDGATSMPVGLTDPSPLDRAVPGHSWLDEVQRTT